jgi:hypothetical protein
MCPEDYIADSCDSRSYLLNDPNEKGGDGTRPFELFNFELSTFDCGLPTLSGQVPVSATKRTRPRFLAALLNSSTFDFELLPTQGSALFDL